MLMATLIVWRRRFPAFQKQEMRLEMILIECLFEWAGEFAGIIGVFIVLLLVGAGVFFVGTYVLLVPGVLIEEFIHDEIIGNETRFENGDAVVRDQNGRTLGRPAKPSVTRATATASW